MHKPDGILMLLTALTEQQHICYQIKWLVSLIIITFRLRKKTGGWNSLVKKTDHGECIRKISFKGDRDDVLLDLRSDASFRLASDKA